MLIKPFKPPIKERVLAMKNAPEIILVSKHIHKASVFTKCSPGCKPDDSDCSPDRDCVPDKGCYPTNDCAPDGDCPPFEPPPS